MAPPTMSSRRRVVGVSGVAAVALLLFGTRWGSYIGYNPLFLTDVLIASAAAYWLWSELSSRNRTNRGRVPSPGWPVVALIAYVVVRAFFSAEILTITWARDAVPFLYAGMAFLSAATYAKSGPEGRARTMRLLWWALNGHLLWVVMMIAAGTSVAESMPTMPGSDVHFLSRRPDVDVAVLAMTAALYLRRVILRQRRGWSLLGLLASLGAMAGFETRAGLIAAAAALGLTYVCTLAAHPNPRRKQNWVVLAPILLLVAGLGFSQTDAGERLLATAGIVEATSKEQQGALGTANARENAWGQVIEWTNDDTTRTLFGAGFGPNILAESGAHHGLGTSAGVRSPHNWFVGAYARLGIIGTGLIALTLTTTLWHLWRIRRKVGEVELLTLAASGTIALLTVGALGVVLESPFGAVPFWWFLGILASERRLGRPPVRRHRASSRHYNPYRDAPTAPPDHSIQRPKVPAR